MRGNRVNADVQHDLDAVPVDRKALVEQLHAIILDLSPEAKIDMTYGITKGIINAVANWRMRVVMASSSTGQSLALFRFLTVGYYAFASTSVASTPVISSFIVAIEVVADIGPRLVAGVPCEQPIWQAC